VFAKIFSTSNILSLFRRRCCQNKRNCKRNPNLLQSTPQLHDIFPGTERLLFRCSQFHLLLESTPLPIFTVLITSLAYRLWKYSRTMLGHLSESSLYSYFLSCLLAHKVKFKIITVILLSSKMSSSHSFHSLNWAQGYVYSSYIDKYIYYVIFQRPSALYRSDFRSFVPSVCNVVHYSFLFLYWTLRVSTELATFRVYRLLRLRILLLPVIRLSFLLS
jgi:hypothetical protein